MMSCAVVIPIYRDRLEPIEKFSLDNNVNKLRRFPIYFVIPRNLNTTFLQAYVHLKIIRFDDEFFQGYNGYNKMMLSKEFYQSFEDYEKILICQLDAYVFEDKLEYFCTLPYDYIGAMTFLHLNKDGTYQVFPGNGGFSLRNVKNTLRFLREHSKERNEWVGAEDEFFSLKAIKYPDEFSIAPASISSSFAFDRFVSIMYEWKDGRKPFGIHAWYVYDPLFVYQFMMKDRSKILDSILEKKSKEEVMNSLYDFLSRHSVIVLYGAGIWGKVVGRALQILQIHVSCFAISDGCEKAQQEIFGIPVCYWTETDVDTNNTGVIFTILQRYQDADEMVHTRQMIYDRGVDEIFDIDNQLFNFLAEIILRAGGFP